MSRSPQPGPDNTIARARGAKAEGQSTRKGDIPDAVLDRYLVERDRLGRAERFYRDHRVASPSFRDHGGRLTSESAYPDAVADMLKVARHRGWSRVRTTGDAVFRREVWIQARALGLEVSGYRPRERDHAAVGEPAPHLPDQMRKRLDAAAVIVRGLIPDGEAARRLLDRAIERAAQARPRDPLRETGRRDRDRR
ncbi:LPD7 domain-containing protein [Brevundimonas naejangsanensis]|uniref:LPD7 domain-containing protein n=1 Tax=Brevundimonas naejangsanensis TaxID=588932 RepID=UPI003208F88C